MKGQATPRSELSEYKSLLRALRTADSLDITTQLARTRIPSAEPPAAATEGGAPAPKRQARDGWDRWPLLPSDVHVPEWGFEDEVQLLVSQAADTDALDDTPLPPAMYEACVAHLSSVLSHVAAHVPLTARSLQDRFSPLGWESVLQIVSASSLVDERCASLTLSLSALSMRLLGAESCNF
jgi:hypothetical protein